MKNFIIYWVAGGQNGAQQKYGVSAIKMADAYPNCLDVIKEIEEGESDIPDVTLMITGIQQVTDEELVIFTRGKK